MILLFELRWGEKGEGSLSVLPVGRRRFKKKKKRKKKGSNELKWIKVNREI